MTPIIALISAIAVFIVVLILFLNHDLNKWRQNKPVDHGGKSVLRRLPFQLPSVALFSLYALNWWAVPVSYLMICAFWWEFFDGIYNVSRGYRWRFNGSFNDPGHTDAGTDKFLRRLKPWQQMIVKWVLIAGFTFWYITLIK